MEDECGQELGLDPGQRGAMEGVRSDRDVAGSVLRHSVSPTPGCS